MKTLEQQFYQGQLNKIHDYEISNENYHIMANWYCEDNKIELNIEAFNQEHKYYQSLSIKRDVNSIEQINKIIDAFENLLKALK